MPAEGDGASAEGLWACRRRLGGSREELEQRVIPSTRLAGVAGQWHVGGRREAQGSSQAGLARVFECSPQAEWRTKSFRLEGITVLLLRLQRTGLELGATWKVLQTKPGQALSHAGA